MPDIDLLLTNAIVVTMDQDFQIFDPGAVAVNGDSILAVGHEASLMKQYTARQTHNCAGKILMPGLINAHTHVPMTLLRGLADDLRLDVWLMGYMMPVEREFVSPDFVKLGTKLACAEMIRSGVTCFADMYYFEESIAEAVAEAGMRAICSQSLLKFPTPDANSYEEALAYTETYMQRWKNHPLVVPSVAPHAPYTCPPEILHAATALAVKYQLPFHTHLSETALEVENMRNEQGMPVIPYVKKQGIFEASVLAAHCVHIDEGEIRTLQRAGAGIAHNPSSNLKLASGVAPTRRMLELGCNVGIGTDGAASNNDLDMFEEMRLASFIAKGTSGDPTVLPAQTTLLMGTRMGAQAIHLEHLTGSIQPGKRADLILVDIQRLHNSPRFTRDPQSVYAQIIYAGKASDVSDVMVNGQWLMQNHLLTTLNEQELLDQSQQYARRIDQFLIRREKSVLSKLVAIGGTMQEESFEVQTKIRITDPAPILAALKNPELELVRQRHYHEYDTYFAFEDASQGLLRYREDEFISAKGEISNVRSRLTLIGQMAEKHFPSEVILSRSRYLAPATQSLRFYREYFRPDKEFEIQKDRFRYLVRYSGTEFYINIDEMIKPALGFYLEIKSRTWSRKDAEEKSRLSVELVNLLGASSEETISKDYFEMAYPA